MLVSANSHLGSLVSAATAARRVTSAVTHLHCRSVFTQLGLNLILFDSIGWQWIPKVSGDQGTRLKGKEGLQCLTNCFPGQPGLRQIIPVAAKVKSNQNDPKDREF